MSHYLLSFTSGFLLKSAPVRSTSIVFGLLLLVLIQSCRTDPEELSGPVAPMGKTADLYNADVTTKWAALQLKLTKETPGFTPPVAARALGYAGLALYESVVSGVKSGKSLVGQLQGLAALPQPEAGKTYNWAVSANAAQATILRSLYPNASGANKASIDSLERAMVTQLAESDAATLTQSIEFGKKIAETIFTYSKTDGGHEGFMHNTPASFIVPTGAGMWQPTENGQKIPVQPYWGNNRTFVKATNELPIPKPLPYSTNVNSPFFKQYLAVYEKSKKLTETEKEIAVWWADNPGETSTPPGHSYYIARTAILKQKADLGKAAETFARTGLAVSDAFVMCWRCKFTYNNLRPYTYVRLAIDPTWTPFWPAPPFPGFPSGHATQSSAAATVLTDVFGDNFAFIDDSHVGRERDALRGVDYKPRSFASFAASAQESADSRFYGNIHTDQDNAVGLTEGKKIGGNVNALQWRK